MDTPSRNYPPGDQRVSDAHRDHAVSELSEAFQTGRITTDEFEQRSGRALSARTGKDLTDLFTDLQKDNVPAARTAAGRLARSPRAAGTWIAMGASGAAAASLAFLTLVNALTADTNPGLTLPQREARRALAEQVLRCEGFSISVPLPPSGAYGIDWVGIVTPAVITVPGLRTFRSDVPTSRATPRCPKRTSSRRSPPAAQTETARVIGMAGTWSCKPQSPRGLGSTARTRFHRPRTTERPDAAGRRQGRPGHDQLASR